MSQIVLSPKEQEYVQMLEDLNAPQGDGIAAGLTHRLHAKQIEIIKAVFKNNKRLVFVPCGRKFGKSETAAYALWYSAINFPGSVNYYICPENAHGRKIIWDTSRIQKFMGINTSNYIEGINNTEMKVRLKNGSMIQVVGSDNWAAANGLTPSFVVYDEFKAFNPKWHTEFAPNLIAKAAPLLIIGTMPKVGDPNKAEYESLMAEAEQNLEGAVYKYTTWDNPIMTMPAQKAAIESEIRRLRARGEEDVVQREYYSKIVPGGSKSIFPMFDQPSHVKDHNSLVNKLYRDRHKLEWFVVADPGTTTCFAVLFGCINPYTKVVYLMDEIYERSQKDTSTRKIFPRISEICLELHPNGDLFNDWVKTVDEAAAWFANEVMDHYGMYFTPTAKTVNKKENGISLIKDLLLTNYVEISSRCVHLCKEMVEYAKDDNGEIPKRKGVNDHLIDCFRYLLGAANYTIHEEIEKLIPRDVSEEYRDEIRKGLLVEPKEEEDIWNKSFDWI